MELYELSREKENGLSDFKFADLKDVSKLTKKDMFEYLSEMQEKFLIALNDYELEQENSLELESRIEYLDEQIEDLETTQIDEDFTYNARNAINELLYDVTPESLPKIKQELKYISAMFDYQLGNNSVKPTITLFWYARPDKRSISCRVHG